MFVFITRTRRRHVSFSGRRRLSLANHRFGEGCQWMCSPLWQFLCMLCLASNSNRDPVLLQWFLCWKEDILLHRQCQVLQSPTQRPLGEVQLTMWWPQTRLMRTTRRCWWCCNQYTAKSREMEAWWREFLHTLQLYAIFVALLLIITDVRNSCDAVKQCL